MVKKVKISKTTLKNAADVGLSVSEDDSGSKPVINIRNAENSMIYCSYRLGYDGYELQEQTTMNAEDFNELPDIIADDAGLNEVCLTVSDSVQ